MHSSECMSPRQGRQNATCYELKHVFGEISTHARHRWKFDMLLESVHFRNAGPIQLRMDEFSTSGADSTPISLLAGKTIRNDFVTNHMLIFWI